MHLCYGLAGCAVSSQCSGVGALGACVGVIRAGYTTEILIPAVAALCWDVCCGRACRGEEEASIAWWWAWGCGEYLAEEGEIIFGLHKFYLEGVETDFDREVVGGPEV